MKTGRIPELDGIRGCAIVLVLIWHYVWALLPTPAPHTLAANLRAAISLTWSGVDLFFVLSGFLIAGILLDHREASHYFRVFYVRRVCRILPLYFLLLGLFVLFVACGVANGSRFDWLFRDPFPLWTYATFTQNIPMGLAKNTGANWLGVTWSLAVEEQFYLCIPIMIWLFSRRAFVVVSVALIALAPLLRGLWGDSVLTLWRADSLLTGAVLAVAVRDRSFMRLVQSNVPILYSIFMALFAGAVLLSINLKVFSVANHTWLAALFATTILIAVADPRTFLAAILRRRILVWLGTVSYGLYMYHQAISGLVHATLGDGAPSLSTPKDLALTIFALMLTLIAAIVSFYFFERPILVLGQKAKYRFADSMLTEQSKTVVHVRTVGTLTNNGIDGAPTVLPTIPRDVEPH